MRRRRGTAMVAVMVMALVMAALGATMLTSARGSRRKTRKVALRVQREMVLDAAFVHGFHALKNHDVDLENPLASVQPPGGSGDLAGVPYEFRLTPDPKTKTVRIDAVAGDEKSGKMDGYAVAYLKLDDDEYQTRIAWTIRYFGPAPPEKTDE